MTSLGRHRDFHRLWAGQTISVFGSLVTRTALPFTAILVLDAGAPEVALIAAADLVPGLLTGLLAGVWVDRLRRRPLMIAADLGRALLLLSIPLAAWFYVLRLEHLVVVAFLSAVLTLLFDVAYHAHLPTLVPHEALAEGNSRLAASASVAEVGAFGLGGWLVQWFTAPLALLIDSATFIASALSIRSIRAPEPAPAPAEGRESFSREIGAGVRAVFATSPLRTLAAADGMVGFSMGLSGTLILLFVTRDLGIPTGLQGMIYAFGGISSLLGALAAVPVARAIGLGPTMILGLSLAGVGGMMVPLAHGAGAVAIALLLGQQVVGDGAMTAYEIHQQTLRQQLTPGPLLGRVQGTLRVARLGALLAGTLAAALLADRIGMRSTLVLGAGGRFVAAALLVLSPVGRWVEAGNSSRAIEPGARP